MASMLDTFLVAAVSAAFHDLDIFCQVSMKIQRSGLLLRKVVANDFLDHPMVAMLQDLGDSAPGLLLIPQEAAILLSASMMMVPKERIGELMLEGELDDEGELTVHEVGNILTGSLSRLARERTKHTHDIRLKDVVFNPDKDLSQIPVLNQVCLCYWFAIRTKDHEPMVCDLFLDVATMRALFPDESIWHSPPGEGRADSDHGAREEGELEPHLPALETHALPPPPASWGPIQRPPPSPGHVRPNVRAMHDLLAQGDLEESLSLRGSHVLVVDDSWVARRAIARLLLPHGCIIHDARDTGFARQVLRETSIDVILLDLILPGESGLSFCTRLSSEGMTERTPVVVISGNSTSENVVQAIRAGASFFLVKPLQEESLVRVLRGLLRQYNNPITSLSLGIGSIQ